MANRVDLPIAYFGILRGGMVAVPMNPRSTTREIGRMLDDAKVKVVLCDEAGAAAGPRGLAATTRPTAPSWSTAPSRSTARPRSPTSSADAPDVDPAAPRDAEALAVILYTSGTSGKPRGVMLSHRALIANIEQTAAIDPPPVTARRRLPRAAADVPHLRAQRGARASRAPGRVHADGRRFRPGRPARHHRRRGRHQPAAGAAGRGGVGRARRPAREARRRLAGAVRRVDARSRARRLVLRVVRPPRRAGLRAHRDRAGHRDDARLAARARRRAQAGFGRTSAAGHRGPRRRLQRQRRLARATRPSCGCAATTSSPATGPTASTARTRTAGTPPATSASSTTTAT